MAALGGAVGTASDVNLGVLTGFPEGPLAVVRGDARVVGVLVSAWARAEDVSWAISSLALVGGTAGTCTGQP